MSSLEKCLISSLAHVLIGLFIFLVFSSMSQLYILEIICQLFHLLSFYTILKAAFSPCLLTVSFVMQNLSLIRSHLFIFVIISITLGDGSQRILLWFMLESVLPTFSSKSFIVSGLTIRSLTHFEFIFVYGVRKCSSFILL